MRTSEPGFQACALKPLRGALPRARGMLRPSELSGLHGPVPSLGCALSLNGSSLGRRACRTPGGALRKRSGVKGDAVEALTDGRPCRPLRSLLPESQTCVVYGELRLWTERPDAQFLRRAADGRAGSGLSLTSAAVQGSQAGSQALGRDRGRRADHVSSLLQGVCQDSRPGAAKSWGHSDPGHGQEE